MDAAQGMLENTPPLPAPAGEEEIRRGPWMVEEDLLLIRHVAEHGEGRWNSLARRAGLKRTGKSCRLRWLNYLRPDVRRGNITAEEQLLILELHSRWGNRWSKIARFLPGRTDNEIKNYWRTRVQKHAKQLRCDVNSQTFRDAMRRLWLPRLFDRLHPAVTSPIPLAAAAAFAAPSPSPCPPPPCSLAWQPEEQPEALFAQAWAAQPPLPPPPTAAAAAWTSSASTTEEENSALTTQLSSFAAAALEEEEALGGGWIDDYGMNYEDFEPGGWAQAAEDLLWSGDCLWNTEEVFN